MTQRVLFLKAIMLDPESSFAYFNLGKSLHLDEKVEFSDGTKMTQEEVFPQSDCTRS